MCAIASCTVLSLTHGGCAEPAVASALPPAAIISLPIARSDQLEIYFILVYFIFSSASDLSVQLLLSRKQATNLQTAQHDSLNPMHLYAALEAPERRAATSDAEELKDAAAAAFQARPGGRGRALLVHLDEKVAAGVPTVNGVHCSEAVAEARGRPHASTQPPQRQQQEKESLGASTGPLQPPSTYVGVPQSQCER
jgi:hypothetical protein